MNQPLICPSEAKAVRWLSYERAVINIRRIFLSLCTCLEEEVDERGCAMAGGILHNLQSSRTVIILEMLSGVLPILATLSKHFQVS